MGKHTKQKIVISYLKGQQKVLLMDSVDVRSTRPIPAPVITGHSVYSNTSSVPPSRGDSLLPVASRICKLFH